MGRIYAFEVGDSVRVYSDLGSSGRLYRLRLFTYGEPRYLLLR
jgi:hypothetical protein